MREPSPALAAFGRAGRRAAYHLLRAVVEGLKAVEAVIEEIGAMGDGEGDDDKESSLRRIEVE